jgi:uncharacterized membrane protein YesL
VVVLVKCIKAAYNLISEKGNIQMAGFFGLFDYSKPGPGVPKDAPPKAPILLFFELLQRKFWNLVKLNLMFNLFNIPALILGLYMMLTFFPDMEILNGSASDPNLLALDVLLKFTSLAILLCIPMVTVGPAQAGFTYVLRNYSREEHAFIWSDFKEHALKNFKQSLIVSAIDFVLTFIMLWSIKTYAALMAGSILMTIGMVLTVLVFVIFVLMHIYIYPLMVTFNLSLKQLYKNALIFAVIKLPMNILIGLLCAALIELSLGRVFAFNPVIGIIIYIFITTALIGFITNFYAYPKLKKYMMPEEVEEEVEEEDEEEEN